jgi:hypothetical protein
MKKILYHLHIMWYEVDMVPETLDSLYNAIKRADNVHVDVKIAFNYQTYLETPDTDNVISLFDIIKEHKIFKLTNFIELVEIHAADPFYNLGDWRRENYGNEYDYYVWGESDCLVPNCYFANIARVPYEFPHVVSYSNRKMWDESWLVVEHEILKYVPYHTKSVDDLLNTLGGHHYMSEDQMNSFNSMFPVCLVEIPTTQIKIDGNMIAISKGMPGSIIPEDLHFIHEDLALQVFLQKNNIAQLHFPYQLKAHNRTHPLKRRYTKTDQQNELYTAKKQECLIAINNLYK